MDIAKKKVDMVSGSLFVNIFKFSLPFMLTAILQQLYNAADVAVVGRFAGREALAGVGTAGPISSLIINLVLGLSVGVSVTIGRALGANDEKTAHKIVHTSLSLSIICGAVISLIGIIFAEPLLKMIDVPDNVLPQAKIYMQITFCGKIPVLMYNFSAAILRAKGDTKKPLYIVMISGIINVALNLVFVIYFGMAADGVALATVISQIFNASAAVFFLRKSNDCTDCTKLFFSKLHVYKEELINIVKIGVPSAVQSIVFSVANVLIQSGVNSFGDATIAGNAASGNIGNFYYVALNTLYQASVAFVSQNMGAKQYDRIKKIVGVCLVYVTIVWIIEVLITLFFAETLISLYAPGDEEAIKWGVLKLTMVGTTYGLCGMMEVMSGALRGIGYSTASMVISILGVCGIRILWILTVFATVGTFTSLIISLPLSWIGTFILHTSFFIFVTRPHRLVTRAS